MRNASARLPIDVAWVNAFSPFRPYSSFCRTLTPSNSVLFRLRFSDQQAACALPHCVPCSLSFCQLIIAKSKQSLRVDLIGLKPAVPRLFVYALQG